VYFRYGGGEDGGPPAPEEALRAVSMRVAPGQLAALIGPSGAGKTTISYLVPRLCDVERGAVKIDGHDVRDREPVAAFSDHRVVSVLEDHDPLVNERCLGRGYDLLVARARPPVADVLAHRAPEQVALLGHHADRARDRRQGQGGERQRLAIARVILEDPPILILDEATSALDTESERVVQQALEALMQRRTTIAIAHRLSTIRNADVIFAIDRGTIVERGTHDELLAEGGLYARLYQEQFGDGAIESHCSDGVILANGRARRPASQRARPRSEIAAPRLTGPEGLGELPPELRAALAV
jgi:ATP-binding cassette subfamily B protein